MKRYRGQRWPLLEEHFFHAGGYVTVACQYPLKSAGCWVRLSTPLATTFYDHCPLGGEHHLDFLRRFSALPSCICACERWVRMLGQPVDPITVRHAASGSWVSTIKKRACRQGTLPLSMEDCARTHDRSQKGLK